MLGVPRLCGFLGPREGGGQMQSRSNLQTFPTYMGLFFWDSLKRRDRRYQLLDGGFHLCPPQTRFAREKSWGWKFLLQYT